LPQHRATVAAGFVRGLLSGLRERGLATTAALREAGIDPRVLADPLARVPLPAYAQLYGALIRAHGDEGFALFTSPLRPGTFEFLCRSAVGAPRLQEALERALRYLAVVLPELRLRLERDAGHARLVIAEASPLRPQPAHPSRVFAFEWSLRLLHCLACWLAGRGLPLESVRFPYPAPPHSADYGLIYTENATFGGKTLVATLEAAHLDLPVRRDDAELAAFVEAAPRNITMLYRRDRESARRLRVVLEAALPRAIDLEEAARELRLSPRTLHRRLQDEGMNFRSVRDALRRDLALERLARPGDSVAKVAADLGYSEPSAFFRAFQAWTGEAPSAWRRRFSSRD
jgi:AraC-like DNA-binding protein